MIGYYLRLRKKSPQNGEYNPLQKFAYTSVFVLLTPLALLSGLAMSPQLNIAFNWLPAMFGGRQSARAIHFILTFGFLCFVFGHVFMVLTQGFFNNMRSMTTGWYRENIPPTKKAPTAVRAIRPDIAKALKAEDPPSQEIIELVSIAHAPDDLDGKATREALPEADGAGSTSTKQEDKKDVEPRS